MRRLAPFLIVAALAAGCSDRQRSNPLDPANEATRGAPTGFVALAGDGYVELEWDPAPNGLEALFRLTRAVAGAAPESLIDLAPGTTRYYDSGVTNGVDYTYGVAYVPAGGTPTAAAHDLATPGAARAWLVDYTAGQVVQLTADARHVTQVVPGQFRTPAAVDVGDDGIVWVCDPYGGVLWRIRPGLSVDEVGSVVQPVAVRADAVRGRVWVCDQALGALQSLDATNPSLPWADVRGLATPIDVDLDPYDGSAWVCERTGDRVRHISATGAAIGSAAATAPSRVAVDSLTRRVWVTSYATQSVTVFTTTGTPVDTLTGLSGPVGIAIDASRGVVWVTDVRTGSLVEFGRDGVQRWRLDGLDTPVAVAVDRSRGEPWVALGSGSVVRVVPGRGVASGLGGFVQPYDIAIGSTWLARERPEGTPHPVTGALAYPRATERSPLSGGSSRPPP